MVEVTGRGDTASRHKSAGLLIGKLYLDSYPDDWYFHQHWDSDHEHHYRDYHKGRGYYKDGAWVGE